MISDIWIIQFLTSEAFTDLLKPLVVVVIIAMMIYTQVKPRIEASDRVEI